MRFTSSVIASRVCSGSERLCRLYGVGHHHHRCFACLRVRAGVAGNTPPDLSTSFVRGGCGSMLCRSILPSPAPWCSRMKSRITLGSPALSASLRPSATWFTTIAALRSGGRASWGFTRAGFSVKNAGLASLPMSVVERSGAHQLHVGSYALGRHRRRGCSPLWSAGKCRGTRSTGATAARV